MEVQHVMYHRMSQETHRSITLDPTPDPPSTPRMVFVGGLHRSGTSALAQLLASHPAMTTLVGTGVTENEGHYLHDVIPSVKDQGGPGRFAFNPRSHLTEHDLTRGQEHLERARIDEAWLPVDVEVGDVLATPVTGAYGYTRRGVGERRRTIQVLIPAVVGGLFGSLVASQIPDDVFERLFGLLMLPLLYRQFILKGARA